MTRYGKRTIGLAIGLSCLAGYVDASGFLATGGVFVSFMSGNSTRMGVSLTDGEFAYAGLIIGVIALFVLGVVVGSSVAKLSGDKRKPRVLLSVALLLTTAATFHMCGLPRPSTAFLVLAMGAENAVFQREGEVSIGLTYMTGTLVKLGQQLTSMLFGGPRNTWAPYALHWLGLVVGATLGAKGHHEFRELTLWPAVVGAGLLAAYAHRLQAMNRRPEPTS